MPKTLIEELPRIAAEGRREAQQVLDRLGGGVQIGLQTNELVLPARDKSGLWHGQTCVEDLYQPWYNRLIYGDNMLAMQALLKGDPANGTPSLRGAVDLIYIDPPFDSKADYRTKITLPGGDVVQKPTVIEQFGYSDLWQNGTVSYLEYMYPRLVLMRELLSERGSIYVHIDWHVGHYMKIVLDDIFGKENFINEIVWSYKTGGVGKNFFARKHDIILPYGGIDRNKFVLYFGSYSNHSSQIGIIPQTGIHRRGDLCLCRKAAKQSDDHCGQNPLIETNCFHNLLILKLQDELVGGIKVAHI